MILYESEHATIYHDDSAEIHLPTESVDLVVTDPPYGIEYKSHRAGQQTFDTLTNDGADDVAGIRAILEDTVRTVGQNRHIYVFGTAERDPLDGLLVSKRVPIVWDKQRNGTGDLTSVWSRSYEVIYFATSLYRHAGEVNTADPLPVRMRRGSVLAAMSPTGRKLRHPTQKPTVLLQELVESSSRIGETVFDPFAGIGSTGVAAVLSGRKTILVEIDREYAMIAVDRVKRAERLRAEVTDI